VAGQHMPGWGACAEPSCSGPASPARLLRCSGLLTPPKAVDQHCQRAGAAPGGIRGGSSTSSSPGPVCSVCARRQARARHPASCACRPRQQGAHLCSDDNPCGGLHSRQRRSQQCCQQQRGMGCAQRPWRCSAPAPPPRLTGAVQGAWQRQLWFTRWAAAPAASPPLPLPRSWRAAAGGAADFACRRSLRPSCHSATGGRYGAPCTGNVQQWGAVGAAPAWETGAGAVYSKTLEAASLADLLSCWCTADHPGAPQSADLYAWEFAWHWTRHRPGVTPAPSVAPSIDCQPTPGSSKSMDRKVASLCIFKICKGLG